MDISKTLIFLTCNCFFNAIASEAAFHDDLFSLSLDELMEISIASKTAENIDVAPGVINIITRQEINRFGARNLRDVLDRQVNMQVIGSNLYPHNRLSVRGVTQTHTDNKVLLLLNGRVIRDANQGGINTDIYNLFPVEFIERIEIIRGPGSALYGTNAFSGVINIVTSGDNINNFASVSMADGGGLGVNGLYSVKGDQYQHQVGVNYTDYAGDNFALKGEFGTSGTYLSNKEAEQVLLNGHYGSFSYNALLSNSVQGNIKSLYQFPATQLDVQRRHVALDYKDSFSDNWDVNVNFTYNYHQIAFAISNSRSTRTDSQDLLWDAYISHQFSSKLAFLVGASYDQLKGTIGNISASPTPFDTYRAGIYGQLTWNVDDDSHVVVGGQINKSEFSDSEISPRVSYTRRINQQWSFKALYGEAFRSPFATDMFLDSPSLKGNPNLLPETISTWEIQTTRKLELQALSVSLYRSKHKQLHVRQVIDGTPTFINSGELNYAGVELELKQNLTNATQFIFNASYQQSEDEIGNSGVTFNPKTMVKAGISHQFDNGLSINAFNSSYSKATELSELGLQPGTNNKAPASYNLLTVNLVANVGKLFSNSSYKAVDVSLFLDNLTNESIYFPSFNRPNVTSFPHHDGRNAQLSIRYSF